MIAMALSGFSEEKKSLWKEMCGALHNKLKNPYLRAMFAFMTAEGDNYDEILVIINLDHRTHYEPVTNYLVYGRLFNPIFVLYDL